MQFDRTVLPIGPTENVKVMLVGEFPGEQELSRGSPFAGSAGTELKKMLSEAQIFKDSCFQTMVVRTRVQGNNIDNLMAKSKSAVTPQHVKFQGRWVTPQVMEGITALKAEIAQIKPNVIVALGNLALWALTSELGVTKWRGSEMACTLVEGYKVIPTISPGMVLTQWKMRTLAVYDFKRVRREMASRELVAVDYKFVIDADFATTIRYLKELYCEAKFAQGQGKLLRYSTDIETRAGHISCLSIAKSKTESICIPFMNVLKPEGHWTLEEEAEIVYLLYLIFQVAQIIGQNFNYDAQYILRHWHFTPFYQVADTMLTHHSCFSNLEKNLSFLSSLYCEHHLHWKDDRTSWQNGENGEGETAYWRYCCMDSVRTYEIIDATEAVTKALRLEAVSDFQNRLARSVLKTMDKGIRMDHKVRGEFSLELMQETETREQWLKDVLGYEVNIKSPKQMQELFYGLLGQKPITNKKTGGYTTNDEALQLLGKREPILLPLTRKISELRSLGVFHSTFVQAPLDVDGRIRTSFNIGGTDTYRFASSKNAFGSGLNCQNIPNGGETSDAGLSLPNVRKLFLPDDGKEIFDIDLDSADLRIVTFESDCEWMKDHFRNGRKPYVEVAKEYYRDPTITKHHPAYPMFKALCHGTNYLGTAAGIAPRIGLLVHETERIQKWYYGMCPEIKRWQDEICKQVSGRRFITNPFGYRFHFFDRIEGTIFNQAVAWIPQSTVACLINRAYVAIDESLSPDVDILLQVHDSLVGQYDLLRAEDFRAKVIAASQIVIPYDDPLVIPVGIKTSTKSWGDCK